MFEIVISRRESHTFVIQLKSPIKRTQSMNVCVCVYVRAFLENRLTTKSQLVPIKQPHSSTASPPSDDRSIDRPTKPDRPTDRLNSLIDPTSERLLKNVFQYKVFKFVIVVIVVVGINDAIVVVFSFFFHSFE